MSVFRMILPVSALLLGVALFNIGHSLQATLLPIRARIEGFSAGDVGLLGAALYAGFLLGCVRGPVLVARVGHLRVFAAMVTLASCAILAHSLAVTPITWILVRAISGFCFAILFMVTESWLTEKAPSASRAMVFSVYAMILHFTTTFGQALVAQTDPEQFVMFAIGSVAISIAAIPILLTKVEQPKPVEGARIAVMKLWRASPAGVVTAVGAGLANSAFGVMLPVVAADRGVSYENVAYLMAIVALAAAFIQWPLGLVSDRIDRRIAILVACGAAVGAAVALGLRPEGPATTSMFVWAAVFGAFSYPIYPLAIAHVTDFVEPADYVDAASGLLFIWSAGSVVGPILASQLIGFVGPAALYAFTAAVHLMVIFAVAWRMTRRRAVAPAERSTFADTVVLSATVAAVGPADNDAGRSEPRAAE